MLEVVMPKASKSVSVLFADIKGSTRMYALLGTDRAKRLIKDLIKDLAQAVEENHGEVIQTIGDEVMCIFPNADDAANAAIAMHQAMDARPPINEGSFGSIGVYVRIDTGPVIREGADIFGNVVNTAAKMKVLSKPRQTLVTQETRSRLSPEHARLTRLVCSLPIKGKTGTCVIYEYIWEKKGLTLTANGLPTSKEQQPVLILKCGPRVMEIDETRPEVTIGRMPSNDLILDYPRISRWHARVEYRRGKFVLIDASSNGTFVRISGNEPVYLIHDELQLHEEGIISLGREAAPNSPGAVHFFIDSKATPPAFGKRTEKIML
jgi:adenylate cyclase